MHAQLYHRFSSIPLSVESSYADVNDSYPWHQHRILYQFVHAIAGSVHYKRSDGIQKADHNIS